MGLLLYYPTPVYEKDDAMPEDFNQRLEKKIIDYSISNEEAKNWSKQFYGDGFTSYGSDQRLHEKEEIFSELAKGGQTTVLDVSCYATMPGGWDVKALIVGIVSQHLFIERMNSRKKEEFDDLKSSMEYFTENAPKKQQMPLKHLEVILWL